MRGRAASLQGLPGAVDVVGVAAGQAADDRALRPARAMACTASKSPGEAMGKPASITSTPSSLEGVGHLQLLGQVHAGAGRLLAVAQGGVEDDQAVVHRRNPFAWQHR